MSSLNIATILCVGLMIGTELSVSAFINPILRKLDDRTQLGVIRLFAARLGFAMPFWYSLSFLLLLAEVVLLLHQPGFPFAAAAAGIWAAVIVLTLFFLVPINNRLAQRSAESPAQEALAEHHKWESMHRLRIAALTIAMVLFLMAIHV